MKRRAFLMGISSLPLAGCADVLGPGEASQIYLLHASTPPTPSGPKVPWSLSVMRPGAAESLDTARIPVVKADGVMDYYAKAQFPDRVPVIVQDALVANFENGGRIDRVSNARDALQADYLLVSDIRDFEAKYDVPDGAPTVIVGLSVKLVSAQGRRIVATFATRHTVPATADRITAAVQAFEAALAAAAAAIVSWALNVPLPPAKS